MFPAVRALCGDSGVSLYEYPFRVSVAQSTGSAEWPCVAAGYCQSVRSHRCDTPGQVHKFLLTEDLLLITWLPRSLPVGKSSVQTGPAVNRRCSFREEAVRHSERQVFWLPDHPADTPSHPLLSAFPNRVRAVTIVAAVPGYSDGIATEFRTDPVTVFPFQQHGLNSC